MPMSSLPGAPAHAVFDGASLSRLVRRCALAVATFVAATGVASAQLNFEISGTGGTQIPVATANFVVNGNPPQDIAQIVRDDLVRSGLFKNIDAGGQAIPETAAINFGEWKGRGADFVVTGSVNRLADGRFDFRFKLFDNGRQQDLGGLALTSGQNNLRLSAHRAADFIYEKLTGDKGVFSTRIAYVLRQGPKRYALQIADSDGFNPQNALISAESIISLAWSPDGSKLAYVSFEKGKPVIFVHTVTSGQRVPVANFKGSNSAPAWSPDGRTLAVTLTRDGNSQIYTIGADGSNARRITQSSGIDTEPFYAPDGQSIYFTSDRGGGPQIYKMAASGGDAQRVTFKGDYNISPRMSPDGKTLAYISRRGGRFQLFTLDLASGQESALTDTAKDEAPSFAPNNKLILYATDVGGRGVLAMTSPDGRVKQRITTAGGDVREPTWGPFLNDKP
jgi:TolB protein